MSVGIQIEWQGAEAFRKAMRGLANPDIDDLLNRVGAEVESQTRRRISDEKTDPEGNPWPDWSDRYKKTREAQHSLLESEGNLLDTIQYLVGNNEVEVGSNLVYAAHQFFGSEGDGGIPARQALGISDENDADIQAIIEDWLEEQMAV